MPQMNLTRRRWVVNGLLALWIVLTLGIFCFLTDPWFYARAGAIACTGS